MVSSLTRLMWSVCNYHSPGVAQFTYRTMHSELNVALHCSMQWSFGVTCWEIFSGGKTPYPGVDPLSLVQLLENGRRLDKPANSACPDEM